MQNNDLDSLQIGLLDMLTETVTARRHRGKLALPDVSYLLIPGVYKKLKRRGMIYEEDPDSYWTIRSIANGKCILTCTQKHTRKQTD